MKMKEFAKDLNKLLDNAHSKAFELLKLLGV